VAGDFTSGSLKIIPESLIPFVTERVPQCEFISVFAVNKTRAQIFYKHWRENVGAGKLVYTRTATGREMLFKARRGSFDYNDKFYELKKASRKDHWK
jgi:hypothetical protein